MSDPFLPWGFCLLMSILERIDPRHHLAAAVGWTVFVVVTLAALLTAELAARQAEQRARVDAQNMLAEYATQVRDAVSMQLQTRRSILEATAVTLRSLDSPQARRAAKLVDETRLQFPEFAALAVVDAGGVVVDASDAGWLSQKVDREPWFQAGRREPFVSDGHERGGPPPFKAKEQEQGGLDVLHLAVPIGDGGVVVARMPLTWLAQQLERMQQAFNKMRRVQLLMAARDGTVLFGPANWLGRRIDADGILAESATFVVGSRAYLRLADGLGLGWTAVVRQESAQALAAARSTRGTVFAVVFVAGLLAATVAALATQVLMRRVTRLARDAEAIRTGKDQRLAVPRGKDDIAQIGGTLAKVVEHLQAEKMALLQLNAELDLRVSERTRRIERMADESRRAAVTRERLRLARDLHDTLAHSLMALLTQIRLVRKRRARMDPQELDAELEHAEIAAATGLTEARAAIAQMRDSTVRDTGLAAALQELAGRFRQRGGIDVVVEQSVDTLGEPAALVDDRSETAFRIVEEALRNVERHARAGSVRIGLHTAAQEAGSVRVHLEVTDDGVGFDTGAAMPGHFGLRGMHEQAALIEGQLEISSGPGRGTKVSLRFES